MSEAVTVYTNRDEILELKKRIASISVRLNILMEQFREHVEGHIEILEDEGE